MKMPHFFSAASHLIKVGGSLRAQHTGQVLDTYDPEKILEVFERCWVWVEVQQTYVWCAGDQWTSSRMLSSIVEGWGGKGVCEYISYIKSILAQIPVGSRREGTIENPLQAGTIFSIIHVDRITNPISHAKLKQNLNVNEDKNVNMWDSRLFLYIRRVYILHTWLTGYDGICGTFNLQ